MLINLKPHTDRNASVTEIIARLRDTVSGMVGITAWFQPVQELTIEDRVSRTQYQFTLSHPDRDILANWVERMMDGLQARPELADVANDLMNGGLQAYVEIDRDAAARWTPADER